MPDGEGASGLDNGGALINAGGQERYTEPDSWKSKRIEGIQLKQLMPVYYFDRKDMDRTSWEAYIR